MTINIDIVPQYEGKRIAKLQIVNITVVPFERCTAIVYFYTEDGSFVRQEKLEMTEAEYNQWEYDSYLVEWVLTRTGFTLAPVSDPIPTESTPL